MNCGVTKGMSGARTLSFPAYRLCSGCEIEFRGSGEFCADCRQLHAELEAKFEQSREPIWWPGISTWLTVLFVGLGSIYLAGVFLTDLFRWLGWVR